MWRNWKPNISMPRVDVPEFTRCCFFLPLRHGLLVWGYFKMIILSLLGYQVILDSIRWGHDDLLITGISLVVILTDLVFNLVSLVAGHLIILSFLAYQIIKDLIRWGSNTMIIIVALMIMADIVFNLVFIVAGHLKHQRLFLIYYYYSIVLLCTYVGFLVLFLCWNWYGYYYFSVGMVLRITLEILTTVLPVIFIQGYVTLLVRTEARKLANNSNFEFVNNASEATCSMDLNNVNANATA